MSRVRAKETGLEIKFRKELWKSGFRYRKNVRKYFGTPDVLLKKYKTVVFIDSCFWHGCPDHGTMPKTQKSFWKAKIKRNIIRDKEVTSFYKKEGWKVVRVWEHDIKRDLKKAVKATEKNLKYKGERG